MDKLKENSDALHWNEKGKLVYENKPINGSHMVGLVNDMLHHRRGFEPMGWSVCARGLARMNVSESIVCNPQIIALDMEALTNHMTHLELEDNVITLLNQLWDENF